MTRAEAIETAAKVVADMADSRHPWASAATWWNSVLALRAALAATPERTGGDIPKMQDSVMTAAQILLRDNERLRAQVEEARREIDLGLEAMMARHEDALRYRRERDANAALYRGAQSDWVNACKRADAALSDAARLRGALMSVAAITFTDGRAPCFCASIDGWGNVEEPDTHEGYCTKARAALSPQDGVGK